MDGKGDMGAGVVPSAGRWRRCHGERAQKHAGMSRHISTDHPSHRRNYYSTTYITHYLL
jgi:hypothetical protein